MTAPDPDRTDSGAAAPHLEASGWPGLIGGLEVPAILVVISSWMGDHMRAELAPEDIWQETLAMAWRDRATHEWRGKRAFRAWLLGIAKNRVHDAADRIKALKRGGDQRVDRFSELEQLADASVSKLLPPGSTTPSRIASDAERARVMREALAALPRELETVLRLRLFEELPMREVATRIGIGLTTANERFFKAAGIYHERLRALLGTGSSDRPERS